MRSLFILFLAGVALSAEAAPFTPEELQTALRAAVTSFKTDHADRVAKITALSVRRGRHTAKAFVHYDDNGTARSVAYFCHYHDTEIDCHEE